MFDLRPVRAAPHLETLDFSPHVAFGTALNRHSYLAWLGLEWLSGQRRRSR